MPREAFNLLYELIEVIEGSVDRCEADIRDRRDWIELSQCLLSDFLACDCVLRAGLIIDVVLDPSEYHVDVLLRYVELLRALSYSALHLADVERLMPAILLDDHNRLFLNAFIAREPVSAVETLAPAPDRGAFLV